MRYLLESAQLITVYLDRLDWANPPSWYQFPNLTAAEKFAAAQACLHPQRAVVIQEGVQELNALDYEIGENL